MTDNDNQNAQHEQQPVRQALAARAQGRSFFSVPAPLKRVFDHFPLKEYPSNELPQRAPKRRDEHVLHVFTTGNDASRMSPSYNPACLKWQAYLRFAGLSFRTMPSSNHASPSGILPFLQPAISESQSTTAGDPIPSNKLKKWLASQMSVAKADESLDLRYEAYASLVDNRIRKAWLFQLYLAPQNADLMHRLYVAPCSNLPLVQWAIASQLRSAAEKELVKSAGKRIVSIYDLVKDAEEAFEALADLLGNGEYFFEQPKPGFFDASVFAYTALIMQKDFGWKYNPLEESLSRHANLVQHRKRILNLYF